VNDALPNVANIELFDAESRQFRRSRPECATSRR
jgi:hypothetical protein